jgi:hypothetical protein
MIDSRRSLKTGVLLGFSYSVISELLVYYLNSIGGLSYESITGKMVFVFYYPGLILMELLAKILPHDLITGILIKPVVNFVVSFLAFFAGGFIVCAIVCWCCELFRRYKKTLE